MLEAFDFWHRRGEATDTMTTASTTDTATFTADWQRWHDARERSRRDPKGFFAIVGLFWLGDSPIALDGAPGAWSSVDGQVRVDLADGEWLRLDGERITGHHEFAPIPERGGLLLAFPGGHLEIAKRGGHDIARPRLDDAVFLSDYRGTPAYEPDPAWRIDATFHPFAEPKPVTVGAAIDGLQHVYDSPGELELTIGGETVRLTAFPGADGGLLVLFADATSGVTTYSALRSVAVAAPDADGRTTIDFNRAVNLPCAYTDFATCPLPPHENRLSVAIEAGERIPAERVEGVTIDDGIVLPERPAANGS
ncbi:DUF1684 domain-containing protein [Gulosibacter faecalis]|jgi:uncharacterized protein (DUF1684 family)|nr:DUF1684 domain-containing protein [Gulosibacter faecalis]